MFDIKGNEVDMIFLKVNLLFLKGWLYETG